MKTTSRPQTAAEAAPPGWRFGFQTDEEISRAGLERIARRVLGGDTFQFLPGHYGPSSALAAEWLNDWVYHRTGWRVYVPAVDLVERAGGGPPERGD